MGVPLLREELSGIHLEEILRGNEPVGIPKVEPCERCHSDAELMEVVFHSGYALYECENHRCLHVQRRAIR